ncbi:MAG: 30S ribosomal protein S8, partial [Nitrososphaeraceae archaeon]
TLNYYQNQAAMLQRIRTLYLSSRKLYVTHHMLLNSSQRYPDLSKLLLSTQRGLLWGNECASFKIGGFLICEVL